MSENYVFDAENGGVKAKDQWNSILVLSGGGKESENGSAGHRGDMGEGLFSDSRGKPHLL